MVLQVSDDKVVDRMDYTSPLLHQQTIGFTEVMSKVSDF
jgi:hypothetical protein